MANRSKNLGGKLRIKPIGLLVLLLLWSLLLGWGMSLALADSLSADMNSSSNAQPQLSGNVDPVTSAYQLGQELYLKNCSTCHIAVPPSVMPTESWRKLLQEQEHYTITLPRITSPAIVLVWNYLRTFSRQQVASESVPVRVEASRYFKALHPRVAFTQPVAPATCVTCHPGAAEYNFRRLAPEWENAP